MTPREIGQLIGVVFLIASLAAGWREVPFKWIALVAAALVAIGFVAGASFTILLIAALAFLFWYGVARGARHLFGGGSGYSR